MTDTAPPSLVARALQLVDAARRAATAYGRPDLVERLDRAEQRLARPDVPVLVVGEFKKGKSTLVNALLNIPLCPTSDEVATVVPTVVRHGDEVSAAVVAADPADDEDPTRPPERIAIPLEEIAAWASERGNLDNERGVRAVEITVPRRLLGSGMSMIDTPGVGGLRSVHGAATMAALGLAEVVLFVTDASQELTAVELDVLRTAAQRSSTIACVVTKTDIHPHWRRVTELDRAHLDAAGLHDVPVLPVSSTLRQLALGQSSRELNDESGYPALLAFLNDQVLGRAQDAAVRTAISDVLFATLQLTSTFEAERDVLVDPARAEPVLAELEQARARADALKTRSARWQQTLNDGSVDLANEVDHDLRRRLREVATWAEDVLDEHEPLEIWDGFAPAFRQYTAEQVAANAEVLRWAANQLAVKVADHFAVDEQAVAHSVDTGPAPAVDAALEVELERVGRGANALAAARGSYGGVLMFGMAGQLVGLALFNPLTALIGIGMGRRALKEEKKRQLTLRRQQCKQATRKYLDDVSFTCGKASRDAVRAVQRALRDEFTERADQLMRSTREALAAAESAARRTVEDAETRRKVVDAELENIAQVRTVAEQIGRALVSGGSR